MRKRLIMILNDLLSQADTDMIEYQLDIYDAIERLEKGQSINEALEDICFTVEQLLNKEI